MNVNSGDSSVSRVQVLPSRFQYTLPAKYQLNYNAISSQSPLQIKSSTQISLLGILVTVSGRTQQKTPPPTVFLLLWELPNESSGIVHVFTFRYQAKRVPSCDRRLATVLHAAILIYAVKYWGVGIAQTYSNGLRAGRPGVLFPPGIRHFFSTPQSPDRIWGPPSLLSSGYGGSFLCGKAAGTWSWPLISI
jgi:hypothetical protein